MILPSHRLDLNLVPSDPDSRPIERAGVLLERLQALGITDASGWAGVHASTLVPGGFRRIRIDDPGQVVLYANQIGGFRVACPDAGVSLVPEFRKALSAWRSGGVRALPCPACGSVHPLESLAYAPNATFGRMAVVISEVEDASLAVDAAAWVSEALGEWVLVRRRV